MTSFVSEEEFNLATGRQAPQAPTHPTAPQRGQAGPLRVIISHEFFEDGYLISWDGQSDHFTHEEALEWFRARGAKNDQVIHDAVNCASNLGRAEITISNPIPAKESLNPIDPRI